MTMTMEWKKNVNEEKAEVIGLGWWLIRDVG